MFYGSIPAAIVTPDKINGSLIVCACSKYYPGTWDPTFIRVTYGAASSQKIKKSRKGVKC
jgi:hypothetical protein